jgi:O-methyltransferase
MSLLVRLSDLWYSPALRWLSDRAFVQARPTFCRAGNLPAYDVMRRRNVKDGLDLVRDYTIFLQIKRIAEQGIPGDIVELGVYKGATAELISRLSDRPLHLFDTFKGFDARDGAHTGFSDTSLEAIRQLCPKARFYPGWFPETARELPADAVFSLVHIDMDLEKPIATALEFFYPRLSPGGAFIVHDYNNPGSWDEGSRKAVDSFMAATRESGVEIPDRFGSIVIVKSRPQ